MVPDIVHGIGSIYQDEWALELEQLSQQRKDPGMCGAKESKVQNELARLKESYRGPS